MFDQLLETKAKKQRSTGGTIISIVLHTVLIAAAVVLTKKTHEQTVTVCLFDTHTIGSAKRLRRVSAPKRSPVGRRHGLRRLPSHDSST